MQEENPFNEVPVFTGEAEILPRNDLFQVIPQVPIQRVQTQYITAVAVQKPRNLDLVKKSVLREAELAGDAFYYSWPVKNKKTGKMEPITGPSIGLAMAVAREMTNCAVPVEYYETATEWIFTAHFVDLEKGFTVSRVYRKRKGKSDNLGAWGERNEDMNFQIAQSKALRNVVVSGAPRWLIDEAVEVAKQAVLNKITPAKLAEAREKIIKLLSTRGVDEERIVATLGVPVAQWTSQEIVILKGFSSQIRDGQMSADQLFPPIQESTKSDKKATTRPKNPPATEKATEGQGAGEGGTGGGTGAPRAASSEQLEVVRSGIAQGRLNEAEILADYDIAALEELNQAAANQVIDKMNT